MKMRLFLYFLSLIIIQSSCFLNKEKSQKDISLDQSSQSSELPDSTNGMSLGKIATRPSSVLLTGHAAHRLVAVNKLIQDFGERRSYIDGNHYYQSYSEDEVVGESAWHGHFMPGIEALYGSSLLNITHYNMLTKQQNDLFEQSVLIKTLYFPANEIDTLNGVPIVRDYYMISAYDEDTNKDSLINYYDLRHFYLFDLEGKRRTPLVPSNYSVISSEYDPSNDAMFVFASLDANSNGKRETEEPVHIFWFSLKSPAPAERLYE
jgi:hypothetical protein